MQTGEPGLAPWAWMGLAGFSLKLRLGHCRGQGLACADRQAVGQWTWLAQRPRTTSRVLRSRARAHPHTHNHPLTPTRTRAHTHPASPPQAYGDIFLALGSIGWYDPDVYDRLLVAMVKTKSKDPRACAHTMYACALALHMSPQVCLFCACVCVCVFLQCMRARMCKFSWRCTFCRR